MAFRVPSPNELSLPVRNAVQALKEYSDGLSVGVRAYVDGLAKPSNWQTVSFQNSWGEFWTPDFGACRYRKVGDMVELRGVVKDGSSSVPMFTLPSGFRPLFSSVFPVPTSTGYGRLDVNPTGEVILKSGGNGYVSLAGIRVPLS